jgi:uncharacterized membrane protein YgcG
VLSYLPLILAPVLAGTAPVELPTDKSLIIDRAGWLSAAERDALAEAQGRLEHEQQVTAFVALLDRMPSPTVERVAFARDLRAAWRTHRGGASGGRDVLILVTRAERRIRIDFGEAWGAGIDHMGQRIIDRRMQPRFRDGDFFAGVLGGLTHLETLAAIGVATDYRGLADPPREQFSRFATLIDALPLTLICAGLLAIFGLRKGQSPEQVSALFLAFVGALGAAFFALTGDLPTAVVVGLVNAASAVTLLRRGSSRETDNGRS